MRNIAGSAGVAIGNVYRYYKNKDELFDELIRPVYERYEANMAEMGQKLNLSYSNDLPDVLKYYSKIEATLIDLFKTFTAEMTIVFNRSEGTKYAHAKHDLIHLSFSVIESMILKAKRNEFLNEYETALARMLSSSLVEGLCLILRDNEEGDTYNKLVDQLLIIYSAGLNSVIQQMQTSGSDQTE
ncbi:TetR/AcrR family transcriptional regulator [Paenibacillus radicis (ex Xue et al. 2023)]|uniref:TetR/AcrR family transcriptional regulator n=1 Tax=Paenibacillus radicis (ex Xue et al. 2023) TaxID=2972489 RepID=A0ABT1YA96_9BACL|nr:TetR/AcrR family transcriptional regulator [Paenibacillus radicis (ex Xue et al. 2023)]MCR8630107.1 TetR/AcrR family transcriptional regulator [Paenibacillus radicis (ex Xue et al. 2023)]